MKAHTIISALLTSLFFASCQSSSPTLQSSAAPLQPLPAWTKSKFKTPKNAQQVKIETKLIEITYLPGAKDIPTKRFQEHLGFETQKSGDLQPIFEERRFDEKVTLTSGNSILFRGLISDQQQQIEDATPVLNDLPLIGSLFTKKSTENFKTELILLVTATEIEIDRSRKPIR